MKSKVYEKEGRTLLVIDVTDDSTLKYMWAIANNTAENIVDTGKRGGAITEDEVRLHQMPMFSTIDAELMKRGLKYK